MSALDPHYQRATASRILAELAAPGLLAAGDLGGSRVIGYTAHPLAPEPGRRLTLSQRLYLERFMPPCTADRVTSATHRITWTDTDGVLNTGHYGPSALGPIVPIAARETLLVLWRRLAANQRLAAAADALTDDDLDVLDATTTDQEPVEIFRVGLEATGRALAQHALVADQAGYDDPAAFALAFRDSGLFAVVASSWYWELQASTYRRGMIPVALETAGRGRLRYSPATQSVLAAMKQATITDAHEVMARAVGPEGLTPAQAVAKYHTDLDLISRQYALLDAGEQPRCLAAMPHLVDHQRVSVLGLATDAFTSTFVPMLDLIELEELPVAVVPADQIAGEADRLFHVPDMNCKHCRITISAVLESHAVEVADIDLVSKRVIAQFDTLAQRDAVFSALRDSGYNPVADSAVR